MDVPTHPTASGTMELVRIWIFLRKMKRNGYATTSVPPLRPAQVVSLLPSSFALAPTDRTTYRNVFTDPITAVLRMCLTALKLNTSQSTARRLTVVTSVLLPMAVTGAATNAYQETKLSNVRLHAPTSHLASLVHWILTADGAQLLRHVHQSQRASSTIHTAHARMFGETRNAVTLASSTHHATNAQMMQAVVGVQ